MQLGKLILGKRLGREEIHGAVVGAFQDCVQDWQVVAERLPGSRRRDNDHVLAGVDRFGRSSLVAVELANTLTGVSRSQIDMRPGRELRPLRLSGREGTNRGKDFAPSIASGEPTQP